MTRKVAALYFCVVLTGVLMLGALGCAAPGGGPLGVQYAYTPNAGDCTTDIFLTSSNGVDPRTTVAFDGVPGTASEGLSETVGVSPTQSSNKVLFHAPCDMPTGTYNIRVIPPNADPFVVGQYSKL